MSGRGGGKQVPLRRFAPVRNDIKRGRTAAVRNGIETGRTATHRNDIETGQRAAHSTPRFCGGRWPADCKERGEWAELCFMARAAGEGIRVLKPYGDTASYDLATDGQSRIQRVQVKSTIYWRRGGEYSLNVMGRGRKAYPKGSVDFFAVYVIPIDEWYVIPYEAMGGRLTLHFTPGSRRSKWGKYREAWWLLRGGSEEIDRILACVGEDERAVVMILVSPEWPRSPEARAHTG